MRVISSLAASRARGRAGDDDVARLAKIADGDEVAFAELFELHAPLLRRRLDRLLGPGGAVDEVLQDTFLRVWQVADSYQPSKSPPRSWLLLLARSRALDRLRARQSRRRREQVASRGGDTAAEPRGTRLLERAELSFSLQRALAELPREQRQCVELQFWGGLSQRQIAERLAQPLGTVKSRVLLGVKKLRRSLVPA